MELGPVQGQYSEALLGSPQINQKIFNEINKIPVEQDTRESNDSYAYDANPLIGKQSSDHLRSLFSTVLLISGLGMVLGLNFSGKIQMTKSALIGVCVGIYILYLCLALICNPLFSYFNNLEHGENFQNQYNKVRRINGYFSFFVQCYHYERISRSNTNGQTTVSQEKIVTHTATEKVIPKSCYDESGMVDQVKAETKIIFVHNKVRYRFKNQQSRAIYQNLWYSFKARHRRDRQQIYTEKFVLPGLKDRMSFFIGQKPPNYCLLLVLSALFGIVWPFSMWIQSKINRFKIQYLKVIEL